MCIHTQRHTQTFHDMTTPKLYNRKTVQLTSLVLSLLFSSNRFVFLMPSVPFTNMCRVENSPCNTHLLQTFAFHMSIHLSAGCQSSSFFLSVGLSSVSAHNKPKHKREERQVKSDHFKLTLMNVGFHTLNVTLTWLTSASGREQVNDAQ